MAKRLAMLIEYQMCRTWGHAWEDFIPKDRRPAPWGREFSLRCVRCTTERHDIIDSLGGLSSRQYKYPDTYTLSVDDRPERTTLRLSLIAELKAQSNQRYEAFESKKTSGASKKKTNGANGNGGHGHRPRRQPRPKAARARTHAR